MINWYIRHYTYTYLNVGLLEKRDVEFAYAPFINFADLGILNQTIQWDVLQSSLHLSGQPNFPTQPKQNMTEAHAESSFFSFIHTHVDVPSFFF